MRHAQNGYKTSFYLYSEEQQVLQRIHDLTGVQGVTNLVREAIMMANLYMKEHNK